MPGGRRLRYSFRRGFASVRGLRRLRRLNYVPPGSKLFLSANPGCRRQRRQGRRADGGLAWRPCTRAVRLRRRAEPGCCGWMRSRALAVRSTIWGGVWGGVVALTIVLVNSFSMLRRLQSVCLLGIAAAAVCGKAETAPRPHRRYRGLFQ